MRRPLVLGLVLAAALPSTATAAPVRLADGGVVDISADGRFVLLDDGRLVDRTGDQSLPAAGGTPLDLASGSPVVLQRTPGGQLQVRRPGADPEFVNIAPDGFAVPAGPAKLVRNGTVVIFQTTQSPVRIIERNLDTDTSTVRAEGRSLLDASEDGRVITWIRQVPAAVPPPGRVVAPGAPSGPTAAGTAVGYTVEDQAPRLIKVSSWRQYPAIGQEDVTCPTATRIFRASPLRLLVSQDGVAGGAYSLGLAEIDPTDRPAPGGVRTSRTWYTNSGSGSIGFEVPNSVETLVLDPLSSAVGRSLEFRPEFNDPSGFTFKSFGSLQSEGVISGQLRLDPSTGDGAVITRVVPFAGGASAATTVRSASGDLSTWLDEAVLTPKPAPYEFWRPLPDSRDELDRADLTVDATWFLCDQLEPAQPWDYVRIEYLAPSARSLGTVVARFTPAGVKPIRRATFTVRWGYPWGPILWTKTVTADTTFKLPANPLGISNLAYERTVTFVDGTRRTDRGVFPVIRRR